MFEQWYLNDLISKEIREVWKQTDYYLLKLISDILVETGINSILQKGATVKQIIEAKSYSENVFSSLKWLLDRLAIDNYAECKNDVYKLTDKKLINDNLEDIKQKAVSVAPTSEVAFNMLELMAKNYPDFLKGHKTGVDIMFSPESMEITNGYYSNNLFYNVHNICGAKVVNYEISNRKNPRILEIGGGLGGGTKQFVKQRLDENLPLDNFTYVFTDIANKMLRCTKKDLLQLTTNIGAFEFSKFNFDADLASQNIQPNTFDVIWGVNAVHVADDMRFTLTQLYKALKPGGALIASETVRPIGNQMIQQEFLLNTLDSYWNVKLDPPIRPRYGFMSWQDWIGAFKEIGFSKVETIPDMAYLDTQYDNCYCAIIRGIK